MQTCCEETKMYFHFWSFINSEIAHAVEILFHEDKYPLCYMFSRVLSDELAMQAARSPSHYKDLFSRYGDSHVKDKMVMRLSYLKHVDPYTGKTTSLYWNGPQGIDIQNTNLVPMGIYQHHHHKC